MDVVYMVESQHQIVRGGKEIALQMDPFVLFLVVCQCVKVDGVYKSRLGTSSCFGVLIFETADNVRR